MTITSFYENLFAKASFNVIPLPSRHHGQHLKLKSAREEGEIVAGKQGESNSYAMASI
jgi:hypothetical protein